MNKNQNMKEERELKISALALIVIGLITWLYGIFMDEWKPAVSGSFMLVVAMWISTDIRIRRIEKKIGMKKEGKTKWFHLLLS